MTARLPRALCCLALLLALAPAAARADDSDTTAMQRLIEILVKNGVLTRPQADSLAAQARAEARGLRPAPAEPATPGKPPRPVAPGAVRVTYVPETVRKQIAAEVKQEVMQQATEEGWAEPNTIPSWAQRVRVYGDVRLRGEFDMFPQGNYNAFPDFNTINGATNGYDVTSGVNPPLLDTTENRTRMRLRARLGVAAQVSDWVDTDLRIATGNDRNPVSSNQTLGQGGDFSKYAIWLDRAQITLRPTDWLTVLAGRTANPFWTSNLMYDDDISFDGVAAQGRAQPWDALGGFLVLGGFPVFNTDFNFGSTALTKTASNNAWLLAAQLGADWKPQDRAYSTRVAVGYFDYVNVMGKTSSLCVAPTSYGSCNTDDTRDPWVGYGNTLFPIRNISLTNGSSTAQPQFYGLASQFSLLDLHAQLLYSGFHPVDLRPEVEFVSNLGFDKSAITGRSPANNLGANDSFVGTGTGWMVRLTLGHMELAAAGDWNLSIAYKYVGSDAVLDSLTNSRFHLGGTNAKGFVLTGNYALGRDIWLSGAWYSTAAVSGPPYAEDSVMFDLNVRF